MRSLTTFAAALAQTIPIGRAGEPREVSELAAFLMTDAGLIVLVCLISPYAADRDAARERVGPGEFLEVFVDAPLAVVRAG